MGDLSSSEAHVWLTSPDTPDVRSRLAEYEALLSPAERDQARRFHFERDRCLYTVAHALVRTSLARYTDLQPADFRFVANRYGRPEIANPLGFPLRFNLSHTRGLVACLVNVAFDAGVDVEEMRRLNDLEALAQRSFSKEERAALSDLATSAQPERFFRYWTLKESYIKARGMGLSLPLDQFSFRLEMRGSEAAKAKIDIEFDPRLGDEPRDWQFAQLFPTPEHALAVALRRGEKADVAVVTRWTVPLVPGEEPVSMSTWPRAPLAERTPHRP